MTPDSIYSCRDVEILRDRFSLSLEADDMSLYVEIQDEGRFLLAEIAFSKEHMIFQAKRLSKEISDYIGVISQSKKEECSWMVVTTRNGEVIDVGASSPKIDD